MSRPSTPLFRSTAPARIPSRSRRYATYSCILLTPHTFAAMVGHDRRCRTERPQRRRTPRLAAPDPDRKRRADRFPPPAAMLRQRPRRARRLAAAGAPRRPHASAEAEREMEALHRLGARLVGRSEPAYPVPLAAIEDAPPLLCVLGDISLLNRRTVAVVGARAASANGRRLAEDIARDLGAAGFAIASGLARGIDAAAHRGSLATGTIAVVAGGIDVVYPPEHDELYRAVAERGAVIAELPIGTVPQARHFPRRNRLISGLSLGVLVVEAALQSGSLITARFALEQGRDVLAVPGSPLDPRCRGTNNLIRQGAHLAESAADVLAAVTAMTQPIHEIANDFHVGSQLSDINYISIENSVHATVEDLLGPDPVAVDELVRQCHLSAAAVR